MRIALLYSPPWKLPDEGAPPDPHDGPPPGYQRGDLDADFYQTPYGLFSLGAQARRAGHQVKVLNLSAFAWSRVDEVLRALDADLYGLSCWTANRRGVALVAARLKQLRPGAHVTVGGPHATPLAEAMLRHHASIDSICVGESDVTFVELAARLERGEGAAGTPGVVWRGARGEPTRGPERAAIERLDELACPHHTFPTHILMTARGCPWACTFCGAETSWGRGFRSQSVDYVLDAIEAALSRLPVKMLQVKDDTFTTNKKRVTQLCEGILDRKLKFVWSCDTRVDLLTAPLLKTMRLAGCQRLSLGVESGSQRILDLIDKKITVDEILTSTRLAKEAGIKVRYYMMLGNRGETRETFAETLQFLERARPHEYLFSCLSVYPGTIDFRDAVAAGWLDPEAYFRERFQELKTPFDASPEDTALMNAWFREHVGLQTMHVDGVPECRAILERLGDHDGAHLDLGAACYREGELELAERHVTRALELGHPLPGLVHNHLGCIAKARGDVDAMMSHFMTAARLDPQHWVLIQNVNAARAWFAARGPERGLPLELSVRHDFQLLERTAQPTLPGPLAEDFAVWSDADLGPQPEGDYLRLPGQEGSRRDLGDKHRLRVV